MADTEQREGELLPCQHPMTRFKVPDGRMLPIGLKAQEIPFGRLPAKMWCTEGCGWLAVSDEEFAALTEGGRA
jgi:hypothetical protein